MNSTEDPIKMAALLPTEVSQNGDGSKQVIGKIVATDDETAEMYKLHLKETGRVTEIDRSTARGASFGLANLNRKGDKASQWEPSPIWKDKPWIAPEDPSKN